MAHANITNRNGKTESVTEFNGEISIEVSKQAAVSMEVCVLNKNMKVIFLMVPRIYYMLPWRFRLFPRPIKKPLEAEAEESEDEDEEEKESKREVEMKEDQVGSTQLEGGALYAN